MAVSPADDGNLLASKKNPSHVAQAETPWPTSLRSD
jgi:hypothetical protein